MKKTQKTVIIYAKLSESVMKNETFIFQNIHFGDIKGIEMTKFEELSKTEREKLLSELLKKYDEYKGKGLHLDLSRGKPNATQLDVSNGLLSVDLISDHYALDGTDCRNYGMLYGLPEAKKFFAELFELNTEDVMVCGNSSLQLMYDTLARAMLFGLYGSPRPWSQEEGLKWICVVPGYDRHFRITELLGFELVTVRMTKDGPDMDEVERLVKDPKVKGIWCVPKYSNPTGNTYSDDTVRRLAAMECAAPDFRIMWDNAYGVHDFDNNGDRLLDIFAEAEKHGNADRVFYYSSTSKITFPGGGVAIMAASENNRNQMNKYFGAQTIGYDKINQIRHLRYFGNVENVREHMNKLGRIIKSKFEIVASALSSLDGLGIAEWTMPSGGYFISLDCMEGTARRIYELMSDAGVVLTPPGATYPYGTDPQDSNLRIAPTYPTDDELKVACEILALTVKIASLEKLKG